jgi:hypothetical protein
MLTFQTDPLPTFVVRNYVSLNLGLKLTVEQAIATSWNG